MFDRGPNRGSSSAPRPSPRAPVRSPDTAAAGTRRRDLAHARLRGVIIILACVLGVYSIWLAASQVVEPGILQLPLDAQAATAAATRRTPASWAAQIGGLRGDLWAEAAFTFADLLWPAGAGTEPSGVMVDRAHWALISTLRYAPLRADAWLLIAALASRYRLSGPSPTEALRMSYYTGPGELSLIPLRAQIAAQLPSPDSELAQFARRDLSLLRAHRQKYQSVTPAQKRTMEK